MNKVLYSYISNRLKSYIPDKDSIITISYEIEDTFFVDAFHAHNRWNLELDDGRKITIDLGINYDYKLRLIISDDEGDKYYESKKAYKNRIGFNLELMKLLVRVEDNEYDKIINCI